MEFPEKSPPYRWMILALCWASSITVFMARLSIGPLAPFLKEELSLSNTEVGALVSATAILYSPTQLVSGWFTDRLGVRRILTGGILIAGVCVLSIFFSPVYGFMMVMLALSGLGNGCIVPSGAKAIISWFPVRERATAIGFNQTAINIGGIAGAALLPTIALAIGWRYGFLFVGIIALTIGLADGLLYRNPPYENLVRPEQTSTRKALMILKSRDIWMLGMFTFCLITVEFAGMAYMVLYLKESLLYDVVVAGGVLAMTEASGAFGKPVVGFISDRLLGGRRKIVLLGMALLSMISCLFIGLGGGQLGWLLYPIVVVFGVAAIGWGGLLTTMAGELGGRDTAGATAGTVLSMGTAGVVIGPLIFGAVVDKSGGSFTLAWLTMAAFAALSTIFCLLVREKRAAS